MPDVARENANLSMDLARGREGASSVSFGFAEAFKRCDLHGWPRRWR